jgi:hypothetical protein
MDTAATSATGFPRMVWRQIDPNEVCKTQNDCILGLYPPYDIVKTREQML